MKRQRANSADEPSKNICFKDVVRFLSDDKEDLSCDQLVFLTQEITHLYSIKVNRIIQELPSDLWLQTFLRVKCQESANGLKFWLACRTVSKSWSACISKLDFSAFFPSLGNINTKMNLNRILSLFKFTHLHFEGGRCPDLHLLPHVKSLSLTEVVIPPPETATLSCLTQLTALKYVEDVFPQDSLLCLTNLTDLCLTTTRTIHTLAPLTNLTRLTMKDCNLTQESMLTFTKLECLQSDTPSFFQSGKGTCLNDEWDYEGPWLDGQRHGEGGTCSWHTHRACYNQHYYGDWLADEPHGQGKMRWWLGRSTYDGGLREGRKHGTGTRVYINGDIYEGAWENGQREGHGVYRFSNGDKHEGEWIDHYLDNGGVYTFADGETTNYPSDDEDDNARTFLNPIDSDDEDGIYESDLLERARRLLATVNQ